MRKEEENDSRPFSMCVILPTSPSGPLHLSPSVLCANDDDDYDGDDEEQNLPEARGVGDDDFDEWRCN